MATRLDSIAAILREHRVALDRLGVISLAVFGSVARGEDRDDSDIDILVEFDAPATFRGYMDLCFLPKELLGRPVDLVTVKAIRDDMRERIFAEARRVA